MSSVNWSSNPKNCDVMFKLVKNCRKNHADCPVYKKILSVCKRKVYKESVNARARAM